jgi:hypothetical protein
LKDAMNWQIVAFDKFAGTHIGWKKSTGNRYPIQGLSAYLVKQKASLLVWIITVDQ